MATKPLITIIVPVYNIKDYLRSCIDSVLEQTYIHFELILVNDGSNDGSGEVCESYVAYDDRVCVIHRENRGVSAARNAGIDIARGEYVTFIDGDDIVAPKYIEHLYDQIKHDNADIAASWYTAFGDYMPPNKEIQSSSASLGRDDALRYLLYQQGIVSAPYSKLFKKKVLRNVRYREDIGVAEDLDMTFRAILESHKISVSKHEEYYYRQRQGSAINGDFKSSRMDGITVVTAIAERVEDTIPGVQGAAINRYFMEAVYILVSIPFCSQDFLTERRVAWSMIKKHRYFILSDKDNIFLLSKVYAILSYGGYVLFMTTQRVKEQIFYLRRGW